MYALLAMDSGLIKIGFSTQPERRIRAIRAMCSEELWSLGVIPADPQLERAIHQEFWHLRDHGEWFRAEDELFDHLVMLRDAALALEPA